MYRATHQVDSNERFNPIVDIKTKIPLQCRLFIIKRNFQFDDNKRFEST